MTQNTICDHWPALIASVANLTMPAYETPVNATSASTGASTTTSPM